VSKVANRELKHGGTENEIVRHDPIRIFVADGRRGNARNLQMPQQGKVHICQNLTTCGCTCVQVFKEFCDESTLHGLKYVGDKNLHFLERQVTFIQHASSLYARLSLCLPTSISACTSVGLYPVLPPLYLSKIYPTAYLALFPFHLFTRIRLPTK
jgi:hypothetical protein